MLTRLARTIALLALALLTALAAAFGFAQTGFAKSRLESMLERTLSGEGGAAEVSGLAGLLPFAVRLERLRLADEQGVWLEVDDARLDLAPGALLAGRVEVREAGAGRLALHRLPPGSPETASAPALPELPQLPESLPPVRVERLALPRIELGAPILGAAAVLALDGRAGVAADGRRAEAALALRRTDEASAELALDAALDLAARALELRLEGSERGGLVARAAGLERAGAATLRVAGSGPLARWQGTLEAGLERVGSLDGRLALDLEGLPGLELALAGRLEPEGAPAGLLEALGERPELAVALRPEGAARLRLERLRLATPALAVEGEGRLDLEAETIEGRLAAEGADLARLAALAGTPLAGTARLELDAKGSTRMPELALRLDASALRVAGAEVPGLDLALATRPLDPVGDPDALLLSIEGRAEGVVLDGHALGEGGVVRIEGELVRRPAGPLQVAVLDLVLPGLEARAAGELDPWALSGELRVEARALDLRRLAALVGEAALPEGSLLLGADLTLAGAEAVEARVTLGADGLARLPPGAAELLGAGPSGQARLALRDGRRLTLDALDLRGSGGRASGRASLDLVEGGLGGALRLEVPDLAILSELAGDALAGRGALDLEPGGTLRRPRLALAAALDRPAFGARRLDSLEAQADVDLAPAGPALRLAATARLGGETLGLAGAARLAGPRLELDELRLDGLGLALGLDGKATADLERGLVVGRLAGRALDLSRLAPLTLQELGGAVELELRATAEAGRQDLEARLSASRIGGPFGTLSAARLELAGRDLLGRGSLRGEAALEGLASGELALETARLSLDGPLADTGFRLQASGSQAGQPLALDAQGRLAALAEPRRLDLARLAGSFAGQAIELRQPARITLDKGVLDLGTLDLKLGEATARIRASHGAGAVRAEASLERLPLRALAPLGLPELRGTVDAGLRLSGAARAPEGRLELTLAGLGAPGAGAGLQATATLRAGREVTLEARGSGLGPDPLRATARVPVIVDLDTGRLGPAADGPLSGRIEGRVELARVAPLLPLDGQTLAGALELDLALAGRPSAPRLAGRARLSAGEASDVATGLRLRAIEAIAVAEGTRIVLERLAARDRRTGSLAGTGGADLAAGTWQVRLELQELQALASDLGSAVLSGTVEGRGGGGETDLKARLELVRAELRLPDPPPPVPATIPVEEVGAGARPGPEPGAGPPATVRLDLRIDAEQRLFVRGRGLESEWQGRIRARGTLAEPDVVGRIDLRRGFLDLLGSRFTLEEGRIEFDGARPPLPRLDVIGTARKAEITARVGLRGRAPRFDVVLESDPPLPRDEVLSRVLFGREMSRITPLQGAILANSIAVLQGGGIDALSPIRRVTGLDTLDVGGDADAGGALRAGKYVSERVFIEMQRGVTPESGRARVEVDLGNNVRGTTEVRETSQTGFGLEWRHDY